jgi:hypothetical protein
MRAWRGGHRPSSCDWTVSVRRTRGEAGCMALGRPVRHAGYGLELAGGRVRSVGSVAVA